MGFVLLQWSIIGIVFLGWGILFERFCRLFSRSFRIEGLLTLFLSGLATVLCVAEWISLYRPLNQQLLSIFGAITIISILISRKELKTRLGQIPWPKHNRVFAVLSICIAFTALIKSIAPTEIDDEVGYHLPLIRWIEQYGIVPGLANIEDRMGFNSGFHVLSALFSIPNIWSGGLYDLNGLLYLCFGVFFLGKTFSLFENRNTQILPSNLLCAAALVFPFRAYLTSTDADFLNIYLGIYLLIFIIQSIEQKSDFRSHFVIFGMLLATLISVKASSALLIIPLLIMPAWHQNLGRKLLLFAVAFLIVILPWLIRNVIISGYLIYPIYNIDLFDVDWKLPRQIVEGQYNYIGDYARTMITQPFNTYHDLNPPFLVWFADWFRYQWSFLIGKFLIIGLATGIPFVLLFSRKIFKVERKYFPLLLGLIAISIIWFFRFPAPRIGWAWILATIVLISLLIARLFSTRVLKYLTFVVVISALLGVVRGSYASIKDDLLIEHSWLLANKVQMPEIKEQIQFGDFMAYVAKYDFCGGNPLPCVPAHFHPRLKARGAKIENGFRIESKKQ